MSLICNVFYFFIIKFESRLLPLPLITMLYYEANFLLNVSFYPYEIPCFLPLASPLVESFLSAPRFESLKSSSKITYSDFTCCNGILKLMRLLLPPSVMHGLSSILLEPAGPNLFLLMIVFDFFNLFTCKSSIMFLCELSRMHAAKRSKSIVPPAFRNTESRRIVYMAYFIYGLLCYLINIKSEFLIRSTLILSSPKLHSLRKPQCAQAYISLISKVLTASRT